MHRSAPVQNVRIIRLSCFCLNLNYSLRIFAWNQNRKRLRYVVDVHKKHRCRSPPYGSPNPVHRQVGIIRLLSTCTMFFLMSFFRREAPATPSKVHSSPHLYSALTDTLLPPPLFTPFKSTGVDRLATNKMLCEQDPTRCGKGARSSQTLRRSH